MNRCLNDLFSYCKGEPVKTSKSDDFVVAGFPDERTARNYIGGPVRVSNDKTKLLRTVISPACSRDCLTCGNYFKPSEMSK